MRACVRADCVSGACASNSKSTSTSAMNQSISNTHHMHIIMINANVNVIVNKTMKLLMLAAVEKRQRFLKMQAVHAFITLHISTALNSAMVGQGG